MDKTKRYMGGNVMLPMDIAWQLLKMPLLPESIKRVSDNRTEAQFQDPKTNQIYPMVAEKDPKFRTMNVGIYPNQPGQNLGAPSGLDAMDMGSDEDINEDVKEMLGLGFSNAELTETNKDGPYYESDMTWTEPEKRRRGYASALYNLVNQLDERKVRPSGNQSDDGKQLWRKRMLPKGEPMDLAMRLLKDESYHLMNSNELARLARAGDEAAYDEMMDRMGDWVGADLPPSPEAEEWIEEQGGPFQMVADAMESGKSPEAPEGLTQAFDEHFMEQPYYPPDAMADMYASETGQSPYKKRYTNQPRIQLPIMTPIQQDETGLYDWQYKNASEPMDIAFRLLKMPIVDTDIPGVRMGYNQRWIHPHNYPEPIIGNQPYFEDWDGELDEKNKIIQMTPNEYFDVIQAHSEKEGGVDRGEFTAPPIPDRDAEYRWDGMQFSPWSNSRKNIARITEGIEEGKPIGMPSLTFQNDKFTGEQDGGHRMEALRQMGHGDTPVPVFRYHQQQVKTGEPMDIAMQLLKMPIIPNSIQQDGNIYRASFKDPVSGEKLPMRAEYKESDYNSQRDELHAQIGEGENRGIDAPNIGSESPARSYVGFKTAWGDEEEIEALEDSLSADEDLPMMGRQLTTEEPYRRRGYATALYELAALAAKNKNRRIMPSFDLTNEGEKFWGDKAEWPVKTGEPMDIAWQLLKMSEAEMLNYHHPDNEAQHYIDRKRNTSGHSQGHLRRGLSHKIRQDAYERGATNVALGIPKYLQYAYGTHPEMMRLRAMMDDDKTPDLPIRDDEKNEIADSANLARQINLNPSTLYHRRAYANTMLPTGPFTEPEPEPEIDIQDSPIPRMVFINGKGPVPDPRL